MGRDGKKRGTGRDEVLEEGEEGRDFEDVERKEEGREKCCKE